MYESGLSSWLRSTMRQTSGPPDITRTMSGFPSPLVSSFCAESEATSQDSCSIAVGRLSDVGTLASSLAPPHAEAERMRSVTAGTTSVDLELCVIGPWANRFARV